MPDGELRILGREVIDVVGRPVAKLDGLKAGSRVVILECDEEGSRVGPFDEQMVEDLDGALFILRELVSKKASALVDEGRLARISYAIQRILKEAEDG